MKRSEMRELIKQELLKTVGGDAAKYIAEDILHIVEKAGMKPPHYHMVTEDSIITLNEWEFDDESN